MPAVKTFVPKRLPRPDVDWRALVPAIGRATRALARFDGILHGVPEADLLLSPLTTQEAVLSSDAQGMGDLYFSAMPRRPRAFLFQAMGRGSQGLDRTRT